MGTRRHAVASDAALAGVFDSFDNDHGVVTVEKKVGTWAFRISAFGDWAWGFFIRCTSRQNSMHGIWFCTGKAELSFVGAVENGAFGLW